MRNASIFTLMGRKLVTLVFLTAAALFAQSNQGTITGTITDPAGAVVPTAQIEVKNAATGVVYRGGTSATGNFVFSVPAGTYEISVTAAGFKKSVQSNVQVVVATDTRRDIHAGNRRKYRGGDRRRYGALAQDRKRGDEPSGRHRPMLDQLPVLTISEAGTSSPAPTLATRWAKFGTPCRLRNCFPA